MQLRSSTGSQQLLQRGVLQTVTLSSFLTFASRHAEAEEVGLAALAPKAGDARLTLALSRDDVTLAVGGADGIAVAPVGGKVEEHHL